MIRTLKLGLTIIGSLLIALPAFAVPTLQVGAPGSGGGYASYTTYLTDPIENDTAIVTGSPFTLLVAGAYKQNNYLLLGGKFDGALPYPAGNDWSFFGFNTAFNGAGAVLMVTVPDGTLGSGGITIGGAPPIYSTGTWLGGFVVPNPPSNHAPIPDQDYLFFDIGDFTKSVVPVVPNFADPADPEGLKLGQVKTLDVTITGFEWAHFDVLALLSQWDRQRVGGVWVYNTITSVQGNPGSHDATWNSVSVPEPSTVLLLGAGLVGFGVFARRRRVK